MNTSSPGAATSQDRRLAGALAAAWLGACAGLLAPGPSLAGTPERTPVPDPRPLLLAALQSREGQAQGVLTGETAEAITRHFAASSPIYIDVSTLKRYAQPGCARLNVRFWQEGVKLSAEAAPRRQTIDFAMNYCMDGLPPKSLREEAP